MSSPWTLEKKQELIKALQEKVRFQINEFEDMLASLNDSIANDTKSSAGDKFETSREMANQEINRIGEQLSQTKYQLINLQKIDFSEKKAIYPGAVFATVNQVYMLAIGFGKLLFEKQEIMILSPESPFAKTCLGKTTNDNIGMNQKISQVMWLL